MDTISAGKYGKVWKIEVYVSALLKRTGWIIKYSMVLKLIGKLFVVSKI